MIGKRKISLQFSVNWLILIVVLAVGIIGLFIWMPSWRPIILFATPVIGGSAALITAINALDSRSSQAQQSRVAAAIACIDRWNSPQLHYAKKSGREIIEAFKRMTDVKDQDAYLDEDKTRLANLIDMLNHFEALSIAVRQNVIDDDTTKRFFRSLTLVYWHASENYIKKRRAERQNARLFQEFEALYQRWKDS